MATFISLETAIGRLYLSGAKFTLNNWNDGKNKFISVVGSSESIYCYRDGSRWVVKSSLIDDAIADSELAD